MKVIKNLRWYHHIAVIFIISMIIVIIYHKQQNNNESTYIASYSICDYQHIMNTAKKLGLSFIFVDNFAPDVNIAIKITGDRETINELLEQVSFSESRHQLGHHCHLSEVKYHVAHVNDKLLPFIPNNADYVSFDPNGDNAVYCHYFENKNKKKHSQCFYLHLYQLNGQIRLTKDDISDMERANLEKMNQFYRLRADINNVDFVYSSIANWLPNKDDRKSLYGFEFHTHTLMEQRFVSIEQIY